MLVAYGPEAVTETDEGDVEVVSGWCCEGEVGTFAVGVFSLSAGASAAILSAGPSATSEDCTSGSEETPGERRSCGARASFWASAGPDADNEETPIVFKSDINYS